MGAFVVLWILGPLTQLVQIINLPFHVKMGFSERNIMKPEYGWFRADELSIAWADMTVLLTGIAFFVGARLQKPWCIPCGFYSSSIWFYVMLLALVRWPLLVKNGFGVVADDQKLFYNLYACIYVAFGLYGMVYLWIQRNIFDDDEEEETAVSQLSSSAQFQLPTEKDPLLQAQQS